MVRVARTGRRPGKPDTRQMILAAARDVFAEWGYDRASIRGIAAQAGVDPALVHHYFGNKDSLFQAAIQSPIDPGELLTEALTGKELDGL
ncbi:MAG TPA: helix-turn-helix domain-containing protein, partial [Micromonosporaceae bacterium]|nr:helix-turn-helix domain-containing protein [Micromonosporaceae bacterium]